MVKGRPDHCARPSTVGSVGGVTDPVNARLVALALAGATLNEAAAVLDLAPEEAADLAAAAGVELVTGPALALTPTQQRRALRRAAGRLYDQGLNVTQIACEMSVSRYVAVALLEESGRPAAPQPRRYFAQHRDRAAELRRQGKTLTAIADQLGCSPTTVRSLLQVARDAELRTRWPQTLLTGQPARTAPPPSP